MTITAVILCGGQGTRLRPVIGDLPKCLAPVAGQEFIFYILEHLYEQGVRKVVICSGKHNGKEIFYGTGTIWKDLDIKHSCESEPLGLGGALKNALFLIDSDPVLVLNGDTFCKFDLKELLDIDKRGGKEITAVYCPNSKVYAGVCLLKKFAIERIPGGFQSESWLPQNAHFWNEGRCSYQTFLDIGTPEGYASAESFLREQGMIKDVAHSTAKEDGGAI